MNTQEIEVELKLLHEKQKMQEVRLKDVDECCGKLKGALNAEMRVVNERIVKIDHGIDNNCKTVEIDLKQLQEQNKTQFQDIQELKKENEKQDNNISKVDEKLDQKISKITGYYMTFTLGILASLAIGLIALIR